MHRTLTSLTSIFMAIAGMSTGLYAAENTKHKSPDWDFNNPELGFEWNKKDNLVSSNYSLTERNGFLRLKGSGMNLDNPKFSSLAAQHKGDEKFQASTRVEAQGGTTAGLTVYLNPSVHADLCVADGKIRFRYNLGKINHNAVVADAPEGFIEMRIKANPESYTFFYSTDGSNFKEAGKVETGRFGNAETRAKAYVGIFAENRGYADFDNFKYRKIIPEISPKYLHGHGNPLVDFKFTADPTAVEHDGRLYVYGTNDHQQYEGVGRDGKNTYERIKSLVMLSTDDMVNWTYHGDINVGEIAPWIIASWAPSIVKREEADGKTHFYLYFSNSGFGTGVLTATSPVGPWTSPLDKSLIDAHTPGLGRCKVPFDPGAVIDANGVGWLAIGAGNSCIMRLGADMISVDSEFKEIKAPHHFEANELNYINDTYVYTYNNDWQDRSDWTEGEKPSICSMSYMTSKTPLDPDSWKYHHHYLKNPGDHGFDFSNNHTHLHKYKGKWYIFYHTMSLQNSFNTDGGFRNLCVDEINVDEANLEISMGNQTLEGPSQIQPLNPFAIQQAETTAATKGMGFTPAGEAGNMIASPLGKEAVIVARGVKFDKKPGNCHVMASGKGVIEVRKGSAEGTLLATVSIDSPSLSLHKARVKEAFGNKADNLCFVVKGENVKFDWWQFK